MPLGTAPVDSCRICYYKGVISRVGAAHRDGRQHGIVRRLGASDKLFDESGNAPPTQRHGRRPDDRCEAVVTGHQAPRPACLASSSVSNRSCCPAGNRAPRGARFAGCSPVRRPARVSVSGPGCSGRTLRRRVSLRQGGGFRFSACDWLGKRDRHHWPERPAGCFAQMVPVPFSRKVPVA